MSIFDDKNNEKAPLRVNNAPENTAKNHAEKLTENSSNNNNGKKNYSLNDDRRVKVLSPGAMVMKRFLRNKIAVVGLCILIFMFVFSFLGGVISPYDEDELFYKDEVMSKEYVGVVISTTFHYHVAEGQEFGSLLQGYFPIKVSNNEPLDSNGKIYNYHKLADDFYEIYTLDESGNEIPVAVATKAVVSSSNSDSSLSYGIIYNSLIAFNNEDDTFTVDGEEYKLDESGVIYKNDTEIGYISYYTINNINGEFLSRDYKDKLIAAIEIYNEDETQNEFVYVGTDNVEASYVIEYDRAFQRYTVRRDETKRLYDRYSSPSWKHWLGTDTHGMDMLTRLMYGGRVSLVIGFIVEFISTFIGIILGGISGYFGKWIDMLIMRIVDVFYCVPSTPIIIILGATMDATGVSPTLRMIYLMLILGLLGWPGVARMVRGQILSLREQEFMTATEACGVRVSRRIFRHLIPNVMPQLIVSCTMGLGGTIITESTLSFLGLGVKFPFASWGNIISDVTDTYVLQNYWFVWIPAGVLLLMTVLGFNLVGDGLRDAFDPKMKR